MLEPLRLIKSVSHLAVILFVATNLGVNQCADPSINLSDFNEKVSGHVLDLLDTGKYNLSYFTDLANETYILLNNSGNAMVSSDDVRCSRVGSFYLKNGGNAIDAAIAATLCLSVIEFQSTGLAGGGVALSYMRRKIRALDFRESSSHCHICNGTLTINKDGRVFGIPGMVMGLYDLWRLGGRIEWKSLFDIPILIAYKGWQIKPSFYETVKNNRGSLIKDTFLGQMLFQDGEPKKVGEYLRNIPLARTLFILSNNHQDFYTGNINKIMVSQLNNMSIINSTGDFSRYKTQSLDLLFVKLSPSMYLVTPSRRTGGPLISYMLNAMGEYINASSNVFHENSGISEDYYTNLVNIIKHAYRDISLIPKLNMMNMIRRAYTSYQIDSSSKSSTLRPQMPETDSMYDMTSDGIHGTASLSVVDKCGNAVSIESSISNSFGAKYTFPTLGIVANTKVLTWPYYDKITGEPLYNKSDDYMATRHINYVAPTFVVDKQIDKVQGIFSGTGGRKSPAAVAQVLINHYYRNISLESSVEHFRLFHPYKPNVVFSEEISQIPVEVRKILKDKNILVIGSIRQDYSSTVSGISIKFGENLFPEIISGAGDFRKNGGAAGA